MAVVAFMTVAACCGSAVVVACSGSTAVAACRGSAAVSAHSGSVAVTACYDSTAVSDCSGSVDITAICDSVVAAAPLEPLLVVVTVLPAARDALDERRLVGMAASDLNTLAGVWGGTVGATLRM
jgi:hypothetical protein